MRLSNFVVGLLCVLAVVATSERADAGAASCAKGIAKCVGAATAGKSDTCVEGKNRLMAMSSKEAVGNAKACCAELRGCKKECKSETSKLVSAMCDPDISAYQGEKDPKTEKACRKYWTRTNKKECRNRCRDQYKTPACIEARRYAVSKATGTCVTGVAQCTPAKWAMCLEGVAYCARAVPKAVAQAKKVGASVEDLVESGLALGKALKGLKGSLKTDPACKALRRCKKDCRKRKRFCKKANCGGDKNYKSKGAKRACRKGCRDNKAVCVDQCLLQSVGGGSEQPPCVKAMESKVVAALDVFFKANASRSAFTETNKKVRKLLVTARRCKDRVQACLP